MLAFREGWTWAEVCAVVERQRRLGLPAWRQARHCHCRIHLHQLTTDLATISSQIRDWGSLAAGVRPRGQRDESTVAYPLPDARRR